MALITFKIFDNAIDAHMLKSRLEQSGVQCFLFNEHIVGLYPMFGPTFRGVELKIDESNLITAQEIHNEITSTLPTDEDGVELSCTNCGSKDYYSDFKSIKGKGRFFSAVLAVVMGIYPMDVRRVYKCKECNTEFTNTEHAQV